MTVTVYSKPSCVQCLGVYRYLDNHGIEYNIIDMSEDEAALENAKALGYLQAPVVIAGDDFHFSGNRPDKLAELSARLAA